MKRKLIVGILALALGVATAFAVVAARYNKRSRRRDKSWRSSGRSCSSSTVSHVPQAHIVQVVIAMAREGIGPRGCKDFRTAWNSASSRQTLQI
ncbi:MAG: hypothetical protein EFT35_09785 [Methanophagales archaeon ANME-1-THS]|nr:MAG: hypothetical protein EFT35_09785 [Methanophagales archaeon ANME-1-THS]